MEGSQAREEIDSRIILGSFSFFFSLAVFYWFFLLWIFMGNVVNSRKAKKSKKDSSKRNMCLVRKFINLILCCGFKWDIKWIMSWKFLLMFSLSLWFGDSTKLFEYYWNFNEYFDENWMFMILFIFDIDVMMFDLLVILVKLS